MTDKNSLREDLRAVLPLVRPLPLTPAERREFYAAFWRLMRYAGNPEGPGPLVKARRS